MNRTASIRIKGININYLKENTTFIVLMVCVLATLLMGVLSAGKNSFFDFSAKNFKEYLDIRTGRSFGSAFLTVLMSTAKFPLIAFLSGTSVIGIVIAPILLLYTSYNYGLLAGYIYSSYGLSGIVFNLFVLLLPQLIIIFCLLFSSIECIGFSKKIANICIKDKRPINLYNDFRLFSVKHIVLIIPIIISSILDISLFKLLQNYISF